jgi:hypothetical protein
VAEAASNLMEAQANSCMVCHHTSTISSFFRATCSCFFKSATAGCWGFCTRRRSLGAIFQLELVLADRVVAGWETPHKRCKQWWISVLEPRQSDRCVCELPVVHA